MQIGPSNPCSICRLLKAIGKRRLKRWPSAQNAALSAEIACAADGQFYIQRVRQVWESINDSLRKNLSLKLYGPRRPSRLPRGMVRAN